MTAWRLEWYRLVRTRRLLALVMVFAFFGFTAPVITAYMDQLVGAAGQGLVIQAPDPTPELAVGQFTSNASQIGVLVAIVVAAGALAFDARPELATFLRTRSGSIWQLILPRYVVSTLAIVAAFALGVLATWYETVVLIGAPDAAGMVVGTLLTGAYLAFAVAVTALATSLTRSVLTAVAVTVVVLLGLLVLSVVEALAPWLPSRLIGVLPGLAAGSDAGDHLRALATTVVVTPVLLLLTVRRLERREV
ncbi:ABC transporter [Egicoccus sp. AB-alg6-2]|uniref:ABC transporter n=1 Tax=Egicoccus sp. AB-alg6-2 TaxID=3242692 RepID=UPI00359D5056